MALSPLDSPAPPPAATIASPTSSVASPTADGAGVDATSAETTPSAGQSLLLRKQELVERESGYAALVAAMESGAIPVRAMQNQSH
jgi:hypothetical protein